MRVKYIFWIEIILILNFGKINCDDEKVRREVGGSYYNSDISKDNIKLYGKKENIKPVYKTPFEEVIAALSQYGVSLDNGKTTVEYWPPDMNKDLFKQMLEGDKSISIASWLDLKPQSDMEIKKVESANVYPTKTKERKRPVHLYSSKLKEEPEKIPFTIKVKEEEEPVNYYPIVNIDYGNDDYSFVQSSTESQHGFVASSPSSPSPLLSSTEDLIYSLDAMNNFGPVVFPTIEPTTVKSNTRFPPITFVPRINKKRKLKKKVKTSSPITQFNNVHKDITQAPLLSSIADVTTEKTSFQYTPIYENIDNESINYMDIINSLSNLTELSFSSNNSTGNNVKYEKESEKEHHEFNKNRYSSKIILSEFEHTTPSFIIKVEPDNNNNNKSTEKHVSNHHSSHYDETTEKETLQSTTNHSFSSTMRLKKVSKSKLNASSNENVFSELKKAIDDNDILRIKSIVNQYEDNNNSSISNVMNGMVLNASLKVNEKDIIVSTPSVISSTSKIHRSRFGIYRNMKTKYIDALKADQPSISTTKSSTTASTQLPSSSSHFSTTHRTKILKTKSTASLMLENSTLKYLSSSFKAPTQSSSSSLKPRVDNNNDSYSKSISTVRQYPPKGRNQNRQVSRVKQNTTKSHLTTKSRRIIKKS